MPDSKVTFNKEKTVLTLSGEYHFALGEPISQSPLYRTLEGSAQNVHTVVLSADQADIDNLTFSRFRQTVDDESSNFLLPKLRQIIFDSNIDSLPEVSAKQLLKYIALGVSFTCSKELEADILQKIVRECPGYPADNPPLSPQLAQMLLERMQLLDEERRAYNNKVYAMDAEAANVGDILYRFVYYSPTTKQVAAKLTLYSNDESKAKQVFAQVLNDSKIVQGNLKLFGRQLNPDEFQVEALIGGRQYVEYHGRREGQKNILYLAKNNEQSTSADLLHPEYVARLKPIEPFKSTITGSIPYKDTQTVGNNTKEQYQRLVKVCKNYKKHLMDSVGVEELEFSKDPQFKLAQQKYALINRMLTAITDYTFSENARIANMIEIIKPEGKKILQEQRGDTFRFLDKILRILGFSPKNNAPSFFNTEGAKLLNDVQDVQAQAKPGG